MVRRILILLSYSDQEFSIISVKQSVHKMTLVKLADKTNDCNDQLNDAVHDKYVDCACVELLQGYIFVRRQK